MSSPQQPRLLNDLDSDSTEKYRNLAFALAIITIAYNIAEAAISTYVGMEDASATLFGFGLDSFIEAISGFGIAHMILRMRSQEASKRDTFEQTALRITGTAFYLLAGGLVLTGVYNIATSHRPRTTFWGIVIALVSILAMWLLIAGKVKAAHRLHSEAIMADARCSRVCIYMSVVLLAASGLYELTHVPYIDSIGTLGLAYFSLQEGRECFAKAHNQIACTC